MTTSALSPERLRVLFCDHLNIARGKYVPWRGRDGADRGLAFHPLPEVSMRIHRRLKREFDPKGLFNPGRLYPDL